VTGPDTPHAFIQQAGIFHRSGRLEEAVATYQRLLAKWPNLADSWYNLALLQRQVGQFEAALTSYQQALDRGARDPEEIHLNRGVIYADHLNDPASSEAELNRALALNKNYVPALLNLANLHEDQGARDAALAVYERILTLNPERADALARYASLKSVISPNEPLVARIEQAIARPALAAREKADLAFALGKILDDCAAYDRAFKAYEAANRFSRASASPGRAVYDRKRHEAAVDEIIATFAPDRIPKSASPAQAPIFICGMFRSGSTLVEQVLASHKRVTAGGEVPTLPSMVASQLSPFPASAAQLTEAAVTNMAQNYLSQLSKLFPGASLITDKRPDNFLFIGLIKAMFPTAKIINTKRNPLDNCLSVYFLHLDHGMSYALDLIDTAHYYRQYARLMSHWRSLYPGDILDFDYDDFVRDPKPPVARMLSFCGLEWDDACLSFHQAKNVVKTASVWQVREPLYHRSSGRWSNYQEQIGPLLSYLNDMLPGEN
jgi:tetratricopeptide (TPR) repeat protein